MNTVLFQFKTELKSEIMDVPYCAENKDLQESNCLNEGIQLPIMEVPNQKSFNWSATFNSLNFERNDKMVIELIENLENESPECFRPPTLFRCQNCESSFVTKYCYQRHQCEFNAEKIVLKPNVQAALNSLKQNPSNIPKPSQDSFIKQVFQKEMEVDDVEAVTEKTDVVEKIIVQDGDKIKFKCDKCNRLFANEANLERHQIIHRFGGTTFMCPSCNKSFIDETRLRTHQETHCKSSALISSLYRSDIIVLQCIVCTQVFSKNSSCVSHLLRCAMDNEHIYITKDDKEFRDKVRETIDEDLIQQILESAKHLLTLPNLKKFENQEKRLIWFTEVYTDILYQCEFCNCTFIQKENLVNHQNNFHTTLRNYECVVCKIAINNYFDALIMHWQKECNDELNDFHLPKMLYCQFCDKKFKSHEALYGHKFKKKHYTPKKYQFNNDENQGEMCIDIMKDDDQYCSSIIGAVTILEECIRANTCNGPDDEHKEKNQPARRGRKKKSVNYSSDECSNMIQKADCRFQCEKCSFNTDKVIELEIHNLIIHVSNYKCSDCGQIVPTARALEIHKRMHSNLKPFVCDQCGRCYSQTSHLLQHLRFHKGIKPFACPHENCDARYTIRPDLKDHIRKVHTRERPYKCSICQKSFLTGSVYYQHRLIHSNDRRYTCDMCGKRFFRADALNNHKRIHTNERPFSCNVCGREFRQKGDRNKHLRTQHGIAITNRNYDLNINEDSNADNMPKSNMNNIFQYRENTFFLNEETNDIINPDDIQIL